MSTPRLAVLGLAHETNTFSSLQADLAAYADGGVHRGAALVDQYLVQPITPAQLTTVGLDPSTFRAIVAKGVNGPRAGYADVCGEHLVVDTAGVTRLSVEEFTYHRRRRPMFPYERDACYPANPS